MPKKSTETLVVSTRVSPVVLANINSYFYGTSFEQGTLSAIANKALEFFAETLIEQGAIDPVISYEEGIERLTEQGIVFKLGSKNRRRVEKTIEDRKPNPISVRDTVDAPTTPTAASPDDLKDMMSKIRQKTKEAKQEE